jgi:hypothetical protein
MNYIIIDDNRFVGDGYGLIQAGHGYLYQVTATNTTSSTVFMQVFDTITQPVNGTVPFACLEVPANSEATMRKQLPLFRWVLANGLYIMPSSTAPTLTANAAGHLFCQVYFSQ